MEDIMVYNYNRIKYDSVMVSLVNRTNEWVFQDQAFTDNKFPYILQHILIRNVGPWGIHEADLDFHIFTQGPNTKQTYAIRRRLFTLFERLRYPVIDNVSSVRYWYQTEHWVPEVDNRVYHLVLRFNVRWVDNRLINDVINRVDTEGV